MGRASQLLKKKSTANAIHQIGEFVRLSQYLVSYTLLKASALPYVEEKRLRSEMISEKI